jgi:hypothetical protein
MVKVETPPTRTQIGFKKQQQYVNNMTILKTNLEWQQQLLEKNIKYSVTFSLNLDKNIAWGNCGDFSGFFHGILQFAFQ